MLNSPERNVSERIIPRGQLPEFSSPQASTVVPSSFVLRLTASLLIVLMGTTALGGLQPPEKPASQPQGKTMKRGRTPKAAPLGPITDFKLKKIASHTYNIIWSFAFSLDSQRLIVPMWDWCRVLELKTGNELREIHCREVAPSGVVGQNTCFIEGVAVTPEGEIIIAHADQMIRVIDKNKGKPGREFEPRPLGQKFQKLWYSNQGYIIGCGDLDVCVWDPLSGKLLNRYNARDIAWVSSRPVIDLSPDGRTVVTIDKEHFLRVLDAKRGDAIWWTPDNTKRLNRVKFYRDGLLLCWDSNNTEFHLLNPNNGAAQPFAGHLGSVNDLAVFANDPLIVSVGGDKTLRVWNENAEQIHGLEFPGTPRQVAVSPDGKYVVVALEEELVIYAVEITRDGRSARKRKKA
jgi:WD40 repeat protein